MVIEETNHQVYCTAKSTKANSSLNLTQASNYYYKNSMLLIQILPFPEYPGSQRITISCAEKILTQIIGDKYINRFY